MTIKKEVELYKAWCADNGLDYHKGTSLIAYFKQ